MDEIDYVAGGLAIPSDGATLMIDGGASGSIEFLPDGTEQVTVNGSPSQTVVNGDGGGPTGVEDAFIALAAIGLIASGVGLAAAVAAGGVTVVTAIGIGAGGVATGLAGAGLGLAIFYSPPPNNSAPGHTLPP